MLDSPEENEWVVRKIELLGRRWGLAKREADGATEEGMGPMNLRMYRSPGNRGAVYRSIGEPPKQERLHFTIHVAPMDHWAGSQSRVVCGLGCYEAGFKRFRLARLR